MVKVRFGGGVADMRGSEGGRTYSRNRGGAYQRSRVAPLNPQTPRQQAQRQILSDVAKGWAGDLSQAQRDQWIAFAAANPITDVFGETLVLTGAQMYSRLNGRLLTAGLSGITTPPANLDVTALATATATFDVGTGSVEVTFTPSPLPANHHLQVRATPAVGAGIAYIRNRLRFLVATGAAESSPYDFESDWTSRFGTLPSAGQKVVALFNTISDVNGAVSTGIRVDMIVSDTP